MSNDWRSLGRREFLAGAGTAAAVAAGSWWSLPRADALEPVAKSAVAANDDARVAFFLIGDTHYLAEKENPATLDARSAETTSSLVASLNRLPGTPIPEHAGGGAVSVPRGVIHAGDVIDSGDKQSGVHLKMQDSEWQTFAADFGLNGGDGKLKYPVFEVHGNHDSPHGEGLAIRRIIERNQRRAGLKKVSPNGLHYSWDWGPVHFVNLGIVVGSDPAVTRKRRYNPLDSLAFLTSDLAEHVGSSGRPVVITHHVDVLRYSVACDPAAAPDSKEWDPCDVSAFHKALGDYQVAAILYGHTHTRNIFRWDGTTTRAATGIPVFNVDNSSHFSGPEQAFLYFEISDRQITAREYATKDRWKTAHWTPQVWTVPIAAGKS